MEKKDDHIEQSNSSSKKELRLWPGIALVILQWILWLVIPKFSAGGEAIAISVFGGLACGLAVILWWAFFSRAPRLDRWLAIFLMIALLVLIPLLTHESIKTGLAGIMFYVYAVPVLSLMFVIWAALSQRMENTSRRIAMVLTILVACGIWTLFRSEGITGSASAEFEWRWAKSNEELLLTETEELSNEIPVETDAKITWSGFRGTNRDGIVRGVKIKTDWNTSPPVELWRRPIGPGCSSFAIKGELVYTQEQRGEDEIVSCYNLNTGKPVWRHNYKARFWDSHAGAGPRSTPTLHDSLICTTGATGIINLLNASDGSLLWSRDAAADIKAKLPGWGIASSPLIIDDRVIVAISGTVIGYNLLDGEPIWFGPDGGENYSSPHLVTIDGVKQVLMMSEPAISSFSPKDGKILWERAWEAGSIVQPAMTPDGDILISEGYKKGIHRITVSNSSGDWKIKEHWMSKKLRPDFNDMVVHKEYVYGFEGLSLTCIDLKTGERKWKEGRYGGQLLLLADQDLLIVLTEKGELALIEAKPEQFKELAKVPAIEGKTWNHPAMADDILLVRNSKEMVAFKL